MSASSSAVDAPVAARASERSLSLAATAWLSVAVALALGALAFWPAQPWAPPRRPMLKGTMVFDEFVNAPSPPPASANAPDPGAR